MTKITVNREALDRWHEALKSLDPHIQQLAVNALRATAAQPEPMPWRESASDYERGVIDGMQKQAQSSVDKAVNAMTQRPWVGLTDEEVSELSLSRRYLVREVEAKLKEKNNA